MFYQEKCRTEMLTVWLCRDSRS